MTDIINLKKGLNIPIDGKANLSYYSSNNEKYFALKQLYFYFSVLKTCFSDVSSHLGIKNVQEHPPTPSEH